MPLSSIKWKKLFLQRWATSCCIAWDSTFLLNEAKITPFSFKWTQSWLALGTLLVTLVKILFSFPGKSNIFYYMILTAKKCLCFRKRGRKNRVTFQSSLNILNNFQWSKKRKLCKAEHVVKAFFLGGREGELICCYRNLLSCLKYIFFPQIKYIFQSA